jgi:hypothetical protein
MRTKIDIEAEIDSQREMLLALFGISDDEDQGVVEKVRRSWEKLHDSNPEEWATREKQAIVLITRLNALRWALGEEWESEFLFDWMTGVR